MLMTLKKLIELHGIKHVNIRFSPNTPGIDNRSLLDCSLANFKDESGNIDYNKLILSNTSFWLVSFLLNLFAIYTSSDEESVTDKSDPNSSC